EGRTRCRIENEDPAGDHDQGDRQAGDQRGCPFAGIGADQEKGERTDCKQYLRQSRKEGREIDRRHCPTPVATAASLPAARSAPWEGATKRTGGGPSPRHDRRRVEAEEDGDERKRHEQRPFAVGEI